MKILILLTMTLMASCSEKYMKTVDKVDIDRFMGNWYVVAGRFTLLEKNVHNGLETYTWNEQKQRIDIGFTYNKGSFDGKVVSLPQKGWIHNKETNAHWKVSPMWPLKLDYLIIDLADDYSWTAIGVPNQKYVWIMAKDWRNPGPVIDEALTRLKELGYNDKDIVVVPHKWKE